MSLSNNKEFYYDHSQSTPLSHQEKNTFHNSLSRFQIANSNVDQISKIYNLGMEGKQKSWENEGEAS